MAHTGAEAALRQRVIDSLQAYAAANSELGRDLARHVGLHHTDSAAIVEILRAEQRGQPLTPARLSERIGLTTGATSILLNRLEAAGHVTRQRGHADRRLVTLHSAAGIHHASEAFLAPVQTAMDHVLQQYSSRQLEMLAAAIDQVRRTVEDLASG